jgi:DNA segregation ATPase FtsK/SpoIIIE-like protein
MRKNEKSVSINANNTVGIVLLGVGAFLVGLTLINAGGVFNRNIRELAVARAEAAQPWKIRALIASIIVTNVLKIGAAGVVLYVLWGLGHAFVTWVNNKSRTIHARRGVFPVIKLDNGALYDPNRDNAGAHPIITMGALDTQKASAASYADEVKTTISGPAKNRNLPALAQNAGPTLPDLVRLPEIARSPSLSALTLGQGESGGLVQASLHDLMHTLAVGASGWGKSAFLRALVWQLAQVPEPVQVVAIDPAGSEFNIIRDWGRLLYPVARTPEGAAVVLHKVRDEIKRRQSLFEKYPLAADLPSYNDEAPEVLPPVVVMADEGTNLLNQDGIGDPLRDVVQTARQYGVYVLLAGQSAKHNVIDTQTRDNFNTRVVFHTSPSSRRTVLGETLDDVGKKGRAWAQLAGRQTQRIQCPYVTRQEVFAVLDRGGPAQVIDVEAHQIENMQVIEDDPNLSNPERIRLLDQQGLSRSAIEKRVFGFTGGSAYRQVKEVLG